MTLERDDFVKLFALDPTSAVRSLQQRIRHEPSHIEFRVLMFQVYCLTGQWIRSGQQLDVIVSLDKSLEVMRLTYAAIIRCELLRADVFSGRVAPLILGEPRSWIALMVEALRADAEGRCTDADRLRADARREAPATRGRCNSEPFEWVADGDDRLGPTFEVVLDGKYYWLPVEHVESMRIEVPADLRDLVWIPITLTVTAGAPRPAFIPTRYPGTERSENGSLLLSRRTEWENPRGDLWRGMGQRMFVTDLGDCALLDCRELSFGQ